MRIIGVDLHTRQQTIAMLDTETGELVEKTLQHDGDEVRRFYSALPGQVLVGMEATGSMHWFLELLDELGIDHQVGHPSEIRKAEARKQKHDRRDAVLLLKLQVENRFPSIWMPSTALRDLRTLLLHRHQWVRMRTRVQNALQAIALSRGLRRGKTLWSQGGQHSIESLSLPSSTDRIAKVIPQLERADRRTGQRCKRPSLTAPWGQAIDDPPRSWTGYGVGHRCVFGCPSEVRRWQSSGELRGDDSERVLQRRSATARRAEQTR